MGAVQNIIGLVRDINDRKRQARIDDELKNYLTAPDDTINAIMDIAPRTGIPLAQQRVAEVQAAQDRQRAGIDRDLGYAKQFLRGLPEGADVGKALDNISPFLTEQLGVSPDRLTAFRTAVSANPALLLDDKSFAAMMEDRYKDVVATPGAYIRRGGQTVEKVPYKLDTVTTTPGATSTVFDPNPGGGFVTPGSTPAAAAPGPGVSGPFTVEMLKPHFLGQESSFDYTARNKDTGALGAYQVMPKTGRALAQRLGLAWRPAMMTKDDPASRRYQDAIGNAAIQEAIDHGEGDLDKITSYYYSGSPTAYQNPQGNPKTAKYVSDMRARVGGGAAPAGPTITPTSVSVPPKPGKKVRAATAQEVAAAGYPKGTAAQIDEDGKFVNLKTPSAAMLKNGAPQQIERATALVDTITSFNEDVIHLQQMPGLKKAIGYLRGHLPGIALGQDGQDAINAIENIKRRIGLNELLKFKATSAQGASGFGNLSNEEGKRLESAFGVLERTSSPEEFMRTLNIILQTNTKILRRQEQSFKMLPSARSSGGGGSAPSVSNW